MLERTRIILSDRARLFLSRGGINHQEKEKIIAINLIALI